MHTNICPGTVRWGSTCSESFTLKNGVRQGGIISPYLFNIYVDDLSLALNERKVGLHAGSKLINHIMYADDLVLMSPSSRGLQKLLCVCHEYGVSHDIKFNPSKSMVMIFRPKSQNGAAFPMFTLNQSAIQVVERIKYLGHILNNQLTDDDDILHQRRQIYARGNMLLRNFSMCTWSVKLQLFRVFCSNIYCSHLWWNYMKQSMTKIVTSYHNVLKLFIGISKFESTSLACTIFNVPSCASLLRKMCFRFSERLRLSENGIILSLEQCSLKFTSRIRVYWMKSLFSCYM